MADPFLDPSVDVVPEAPTPETEAEATVEAGVEEMGRVASWVQGQAEKAGIEEPMPLPPELEGRQRGERGRFVRKEAGEAAPVAAASPSSKTPQEYYQERQTKRQRLEAAEAENQSLRAQRQTWNTVMEQLQRSGPVAARAPEPVDVEPDIEVDPRAWFEHQTRKAAEEAVKPLKEQLYEQRVREANESDGKLFMRQEESKREEFRQEIVDLEEQYAGTPQGAGFRGDYGEYVQRSAAALRSNGVPEQHIHMAVAESLRQLVSAGQRMGVNPVAFVHNHIRALMGLNGQPLPPRKRAPAPLSPSERQVRQMSEAAASGPSTSLSRTGNAGASDPASQLRGLVDRGASPEEVQAVLGSMPGDFRGNLRQLWRAAETRKR